MDPLTHLLAGPRAERAFALRMVMEGPWSVEIRDEAPLTLMAVRSGGAVLTVDSVAVPLVPGDVALVRGPEPYSVSDRQGRVPDIIIHPDQRCTTVDGQSVALTMGRGVRTWGNAPQVTGATDTGATDAGTLHAGSTTMLVGTYLSRAELGAEVAAVLPRSAVARVADSTTALLSLLDEELTTDAAGQGATIDRLLDVLLVHTVRTWAQERPEEASGWLAGAQDPVVARVLDAIHADPARAWTLETLASGVHVSRATLAARFRSLVGVPPMAYLTQWRLRLGADQLADLHLTTAQVAESVGYASPFSFSTAFSRAYGCSPTAYRRRLVDGRPPVALTSSS